MNFQQISGLKHSCLSQLIFNLYLTSLKNVCLLMHAFNSDKVGNPVWKIIIINNWALMWFSHKNNLAKSNILRLPFKLFETKGNKDTDYLTFASLNPWQQDIHCCLISTLETTTKTLRGSRILYDVCVTDTQESKIGAWQTHIKGTFQVNTNPPL